MSTPTLQPEPSAPATAKRHPWQRYLAELIGTFVIVFAGCGAVVSNGMSDGAVTHLGISLVFGMAVAVMIYALGPVCAAHYNPAVTLAFAATRRFPWRHVPAYLAAQGAGAILASALHGLMFGEAAGRAGFGATLPKITGAGAAAFEVALTFILMLVIMAVATDRRVDGTVPGLAIGLTVAMCAAFGGPATGASMNPARSLGPALFAGGEALLWLPLYLLAPPVGSLLAAFTFEALRDGEEHAQCAPCDLEIASSAAPGPFPG